MNAAYIVFQQAVVLLIIVAAGLVIKKLGILTEEGVKSINRMVLELAIPALMLMVFQREASPEVLEGLGRVLAASAGVHVVSMLIAWAFFARWKNDKQRPVLWTLTVLSNAAFLGMPLIRAAYGEDALLYSAAYIFCFNVTLWTISRMQFTGEISIKAVINPGFCSVIVGALLFALNIRIPSVPADALNFLSSLTTPLSMLVVGSRLTDVKPEMLKSRAAWLAVFLRLALVPGVMLIILKLLGFEGLELHIPVVSAAMASAATTALFAERYNADTALASCVIAVSTALCVVTAPVFVLLMS